MEGASKYPMQEVKSSSDSDQESDEEEVAEGAINLFLRWKKVNIAVASDSPVWIGIEAERELNKGRQMLNLEVAGAIKAGFASGEKEHHLVSSKSWVKGNGHE